MDAWPGNKLKTFLKNGQGFGMVEFANVRERNNFLQKKEQYRNFRGVVLDIKEYKEGSKSQSNKPLKKADLIQNTEAMVFVGKYCASQKGAAAGTPTPYQHLTAIRNLPSFDPRIRH